MANRYANLVGSNKIKDEWQKINTGFDLVQADMDEKADASDLAILQGTVTNHIGSGGNAHAEATDQQAGFMSATDKQKLDGIEEGAQVNQNAFAKVNDVEASDPSDELTITGGTGITVTTNPNTKEVIVTATGSSTPGPHGSSHTEHGADPIPAATTTEGGLMSAEHVQILESHASKLDAATSTATPNTLVQRDPNGRFKAAAPSDPDDVARKAEVDAVDSAVMKKVADSDLNMNGRKIDNIGAIRPANPTTLTINNNAITVTQWYHRIDTTDGAGELHTINGGSAGDFLRLRIIANSRPITLKHGVGNIVMPDGLDYTLRNTNEFIELIKYGDVWYCSQPLGVKRSGDRMSGNLEFAGNSRGFTFHNGDSETIAELANMPDVVTGNAIVRLFRSTNTSGNKLFTIMKGDGTSTAAFTVTNGEITRLNERTVTITAYPGNPNGNVAAPPGSICLNTAGGAGASIYVKESGTGNTGWVAK